MNIRTLYIVITLLTSNLFVVYSQDETMSTSKFKKEFGAYDIPSDWVEVNNFPGLAWNFDYSQKDENIEAPDWTHISISFSRNPFKIEEHENFKEAILSQLLRQFRQADPANNKGSRNYNE
jgi:hypothetical protein